MSLPEGLTPEKMIRLYREMCFQDFDVLNANQLGFGWTPLFSHLGLPPDVVISLRRTPQAFVWVDKLRELWLGYAKEIAGLDGIDREDLDGDLCTIEFAPPTEVSRSIKDFAERMKVRSLDAPMAYDGTDSLCNTGPFDIDMVLYAQKPAVVNGLTAVVSKDRGSTTPLNPLHRNGDQSRLQMTECYWKGADALEVGRGQTKPGIWMGWDLIRQKFGFKRRPKRKLKYRMKK